MLELVDLPGYEKRKPQPALRRPAAARRAGAGARSTTPSVLLLDEPLGALDLKLRKQMQVELKRIQSEIGITFIFVTHDQEEAMTMSDRIAVMRARPDRAARRPGGAVRAARAPTSWPASSASATCSMARSSGRDDRLADVRLADGHGPPRAVRPIDGRDAWCGSASVPRSCACRPLADGAVAAEAERCQRHRRHRARRVATSASARSTSSRRPTAQR